jgi:hypothetical protein
MWNRQKESRWSHEEEEEEECELKQLLAAAGSNYLPQVQTKSRDFASPPCLRLVFWNY